MDTKAGREKVAVMKAIVQDKFGTPIEVLTLREVERPAVDVDEVLVRVPARLRSMSEMST